MLYSFLAVISGLFLLVWSADKFVSSASEFAFCFGVSPLIIGVVILGFGTSLPEMFISAQSSLQGNAGIAIGNAYGSNIANLALVLGVTACLLPIRLERSVLKQDFPILLLATIIGMVFLIDGLVGRVDAAVMMTVFAMAVLLSISMSESESAPDIEISKVSTKSHLPSVLRLLLGLAVLLISSKLLVWGSVGIAQVFGVSELVIGLTIVAIGTSLPELATSISSALKGKNDMVIGNILGSNLFNTLMVVGIAGMVQPFEFSSNVLERDAVVTVLLTVSIMFVGFLFGKRKQLGRLFGATLLVVYLGYLGNLLYSVQ